MQNNGQVRRVTGSADIPITADGKKQAVQMSAKLSEPFDHVFCSPEDRSIQTAEEFGDKDPIILKGLDAWYRGSYEGQPAKKVTYAMRNLILHPDVRPPGVSPISGKPGETFSEFWGPLGHVMRTMKEHLKPDERILLVTSGGNLQAINELAGDGFPAKLTPKELKKIAACPYWSDTGQLFKLSDDGLSKVSDNKESNSIYVCEHSKTAFNP